MLRYSRRTSPDPEDLNEGILIVTTQHAHISTTSAFAHSSCNRNG